MNRTIKKSNFEMYSFPSMQHDSHATSCLGLSNCHLYCTKIRIKKNKITIKLYYKHKYIYLFNKIIVGYCFSEPRVVTWPAHPIIIYSARFRFLFKCLLLQQHEQTTQKRAIYEINIIFEHFYYIKKLPSTKRTLLS